MKTCHYCNGSGDTPSSEDAMPRMRYAKTQRAVAAKMGITPAHLSSLLSDRRRWSWEMWHRFTAATPHPLTLPPES